MEYSPILNGNVIPHGWTIIKLIDVATYISRGKQPKYVEKSEILTLNQRAIQWGKIEEQYLKYHNPEVKVQENHFIKKDDVVINSTGTGTVGRVFHFSEEVAKNLFADSHVTIIRTKEKKLLSRYLMYHLSDTRYQEYILNNFVTGSTGQVELNKSNVKEFPILLPPIETQQKIVKTLSSLDNKIMKNHEIIFNLEQLAQTLFKRWFVDFEYPNENGLPYKSSGGEMQNSELGEIPKGWKINMISDLIDVIDNRGKTPQLENKSTIHPIIDVKALSGKSRIIDINNCSKYVSEATYNTWFRNGHPQELDILFSTVGSIGSIKMFYGNIGCIAQNVVALRANKISPFYFYQYIESQKADIATYNIGSVQPSIKVTHFIKRKILVPTNIVEREFHNKIINISSLVYSLSKENKLLSNLRDTLLPKLLSGEMELPIETEVKEDVPVS